MGISTWTRASKSPLAVTLEVLDAAAFEAKHRAVLGAGRDFDRDGRVQGGHFHLGAEGGLGEADGHFAKEVVAVALKNLMGLDMQNDVQIAGRAALDSRLAVAGGTEADAGVHAGGDFDGDLGGAFAAAAAAAGAARLVNNTSAPAAARAGLGDAEDAAGSDDLAAAVAGGAGLGGGPFFRAAAAASVARGPAC